MLDALLGLLLICDSTRRCQIVDFLRKVSLARLVIESYHLGHDFRVLMRSLKVISRRTDISATALSS